MFDGILAAIITAAAAVAVAVYQGHRTRRQNSTEHAEARSMLRDVRDGIDELDHKVDAIRDDLDAHLKGHPEP